jgi:hypothetical protein
MRRRTIAPIFPPPGLDLKVPDWKVDKFMLRIGNGCSEYADKFETLDELFKADKVGGVRAFAILLVANEEKGPSAEDPQARDANEGGVKKRSANFRVPRSQDHCCNVKKEFPK